MTANFETWHIYELDNFELAEKGAALECELRTACIEREKVKELAIRKLLEDIHLEQDEREKAQEIYKRLSYIDKPESDIGGLCVTSNNISLVGQTEKTLGFLQPEGNVDFLCTLSQKSVSKPLLCPLKLPKRSHTGHMTPLGFFVIDTDTPLRKKKRALKTVEEKGQGREIRSAPVVRRSCVQLISTIKDNKQRRRSAVARLLPIKNVEIRNERVDSENVSLNSTDTNELCSKIVTPSTSISVEQMEFAKSDNVKSCNKPILEKEPGYACDSVKEKIEEQEIMQKHSDSESKIGCDASESFTISLKKEVETVENPTGSPKFKARIDSVLCVQPVSIICEEECCSSINNLSPQLQRPQILLIEDKNVKDKEIINVKEMSSDEIIKFKKSLDVEDSNNCLDNIAGKIQQTNTSLLDAQLCKEESELKKSVCDKTKNEAIVNEITNLNFKESSNIDFDLKTKSEENVKAFSISESPLVNREVSNNLSDLHSNKEILNEDLKIEHTVIYSKENFELKEKYLSYQSFFETFDDFIIEPVHMKPLSLLSVEAKLKAYDTLVAELKKWEAEEKMFFEELNVKFNESQMFYCVPQSCVEVYELVKGVLDSLSWYTTNTSLWDLRWTWGRLVLNSTAPFLACQRMNHIPRTCSFTRKDALKKTLWRYARGSGATASLFRALTPLSFILPQEYLLFATTFCTIKGIWIMKPCGLSRGRGIRLVDRLQNVLYSESTVVQKYIEHPLLIEGRKFDLRLYVLVTQFNPLECFISSLGFARFAMKQHVLEDLEDRFVYLTNSAVAAEYHSTNPLHARRRLIKWTIEHIGTYINDLIGSTTWEGIWHRIKTAVIRTLACAEDSIPFYPCCFELFGFDVLIDENLHPWILEVNASPSMETYSPIDVELKPQLIKDIVALIDPMPMDRKKLLEILERRINQYKGNKRRHYKPLFEIFSEADTRDSDLNAILRGKKPRAYGEMPQITGSFERLAPSSIYDKIKVQKKLCV